MRAERLGSYSIDMHRGPDVVLAALEVDDAVHAACGRRRGSAMVTMPWLLRPPFLGLGCSSDFSGRFFLPCVRSEKSLTEPPRRPAWSGCNGECPCLSLIVQRRLRP